MFYPTPFPCLSIKAFSLLRLTRYDHGAFCRQVLSFQTLTQPETQTIIFVLPQPNGLGFHP